MSSPMVLFDPASAIAASHCLAARIRNPTRRTTTVHPSRCGWCDFPTDVLDSMIRGFHAWSGYNARTGTYAHHELRMWSELSPEAQREAIVAAQGFAPPAPAESLQAPDSPPADAAPPPPAWLGAPAPKPGGPA